MRVEIKVGFFILFPLFSVFCFSFPNCSATFYFTTYIHLFLRNPLHFFPTPHLIIFFSHFFCLAFVKHDQSLCLQFLSDFRPTIHLHYLIIGSSLTLILPKIFCSIFYSQISTFFTYLLLVHDQCLTCTDGQNLNISMEDIFKNKKHQLQMSKSIKCLVSLSERITR